MRYQCSNCNICGSEDITAIDKKHEELDTYVIYHCSACDSIFSAKKTKPIIEKKDKILNPVDIYERNIKSLMIITSSVAEDVISSGTAFIISEEGYIITNAHVVTTAKIDDDQLSFSFNDEILAKDSEGRKYSCDVVNVDLKTDIAILKLECDVKLKKVNLGNHKDVRTGERIFTIGNSKGEGLSITEGLVSDRDRMINGSNKILISVPVNGGNSGGPIFNYKNEVIGIVTFGKKDAVAMNYAINMDDVLKFINKTEINEDIKII